CGSSLQRNDAGVWLCEYPGLSFQRSPVCACSLVSSLLLSGATMSQQSSLTQSAHSVRQVLTAYTQLATQLAAGQQQVADNIAKLHADEQKILQKLSATPQKLPATPQKLSGNPLGATAAPPRKPAPVTAPPSPSESPSASAQPR